MSTSSNAADTSTLEQLLWQVIADYGGNTSDAAKVSTDFPYPSPPFFNEEGHVFFYPVIASITREMKQADYFSWLDDIHVRYSGNSSHRVPIAYFAASLAARVLETRDPKRVIADFIQLLRSNEAEAWCVAIMTGLRVDSAMDIRQDVILMPFDDLPNTKYKTMLISDSQNVRHFSAPSSALVIRYRLSDLFVKSEKSPSPLPEFGRNVRRLRDIADCIMIGCNNATGIMAEWQSGSN